MKVQGRVIGPNVKTIPDGGGINLEVKLPSGSLLMAASVQISSAGNFSNMAAKMLLRTLAASGRGQQLAFGYIKSLNSSTIPLTWIGAIRIPDDYEYEIVSTPWNRSGGAVDCSLSAYVEVEE